MIGPVEIISTILLALMIAWFVKEMKEWSVHYVKNGWLKNMVECIV